MKVNYKLVGMKQLKASLRGYQSAKELKVRQGVAHTILAVRNRARRYAPVGKKTKTRKRIGQTKNSITAILPVKTPEGAVVVLAPQGPFPEFGTGRRGAATNKQKLPPGYRHGIVNGMEAQPYLGPAFEQEGPQHIARMKAAMRGTR